MEWTMIHASLTLALVASVAWLLKRRQKLEAEVARLREEVDSCQTASRAALSRSLAALSRMNRRLDRTDHHVKVLKSRFFYAEEE